MKLNSELLEKVTEELKELKLSKSYLQIKLKDYYLKFMDLDEL